MYLTRLSASDLLHAPDLSGLDRVVDLAPAPAPTAAADALRIFRAALRPSELLPLRPLGWVGRATEALDDEGVVVALAGLLSPFVDGLVDGDGRSLAVEVSVAPDPPLYGRLREHAVRDPRLVTALGQQAELHIKAGFLFTADRTGASPDLLGARIGDVAFPVAGKERPAWLGPLLAEIASRVSVLTLTEDIDDVQSRLAECAVSHRAAERERWRRAAEALVAPPFALPEPVWVREPGGGLRLRFGEALLEVRQLGRHAADALRLVEAALVVAPDVLVVTEPLDEAVDAWLVGLTEGDDATLEQVMRP
jgi:hypothetical protein